MIKHVFIKKKMNHFVSRSLAVKFLFGIIMNTHADSYLDAWEPSDWFQAEVIIFKQIGSKHSELPPRNYELSYPDRWRRLIDTKNPIKIGDLARVHDKAEGTHNPLGEVFVQNAYEYFQNEIKNKDPISLSHLLTDNEDHQEKKMKPIFELPYSILQSKDRNLNETAAGLARRNMYEVLFHEAWRFPAENKVRGRWVIVRAGSNVGEHFQLEGSIRFYKSRFMHFETKLWFTDLTEKNLLTNPIHLPTLRKSTIEKKPLLTTEFPLKLGTNRQSQLPMVDTETSTIALKSDKKHQTSGRSLTAQPAGIVGANTEDLENLYPSGNLWTFDQARRLRETEIHYLDHPELGIIVTVDSYQPILLNPEDRPESVYE
ncbi:MAG: hypothetical protein CBD08_007715 [Cellvibrionales bacterium TMED148]|nr:hypothetical protein [Porticoccaceae bacterium]RPG88285.1 MAG: hypothetical protein CBD08_007715 [Cellvibrionales bacterium TMED148]